VNQVLALLAALAGSAAIAGSAELRIPLHDARGAVDNLVLDGFSFNGAAVTPDTLRVKPLAPGTVEVTATASALGEWEFAIIDENSYYGFGERFDRLNQAHSIIRNASRDTAGIKGTHTYQPVPFFMSLRGYGLWLDTFGEAVFDLNVADSSRIQIRDFGRTLRFVIFEGPQFPTILDRFTALVGRQQLPPYWAFAPWKSRDYYRNQDDVYADIDRYRDLGLPASVILIDSPWSTNYNTYTFNSKQFADAPRMIRHLHDRGYKLVLWHTPWINRENKPPYEQGLAASIPLTQAENFAEADSRGYFLHRPDGSTYIGSWWKGTGSLIDFTNVAARKWWQSQIARAIAAGADGFKNDDAEGNFVGDVRFASGEDVRNLRNRYAVDYNRAVAEVLAEQKGKDWILFQRSGTTGSHNLPLFWAGDNDATFSPENGLPSVVTAGLNAGMSGISLWISDLGGYNKTARYPGDDILFVRWTQYAALSPGMELMSGMNLGPWDYGEQALRIFRQYARLHMSLFPYRYAAAQESARNGLPMMRSLALMHQDDPEARAASTEYYFGPDLLVAPILSPVTQRSVYLPEGDWIDYWSGTRVSGRQTIAVDAPLDRIPLWVRAGAIVPAIPDDVMTLTPAADYRDKSVKGLDDRRVYDIYPGSTLRAITDFEGRGIGPGTEPGTLVITGRPAHLILRWRFDHPSAVWLNGRKLDTRGGQGIFTVEFDHSATSQLRFSTTATIRD
jgi:alpha-D-xyloside xylohydrolase